MRRAIVLTFCSFLLTSFYLQAQCTKGNCQDGSGTFVFPSGAKYVGQFADGEIHGVGVCYYTDGSKYSGQWVHRYPHGKGTKTYADGQKRTGLWLKGQAVDEKGQAAAEPVMAEEDDGTNIQVGCLVGNCKDGEGVFAYADGSKYEGQFKKGMLNGWGTWYFANGDKYVGSFKDNYLHGEGTLYQDGGKETKGEWVEGEYKRNTRSGEIKTGCIHGDCLNGNGTYVYDEGAAKYMGDFVEGMASGTGVCYYANGERYEGEWKEGSFHGIGTLYMMDGTSARGHWEDGSYMGSVDWPEEPAKEEQIVKKEEKKKEETPTKVESVNTTGIKVWAVVIGVSSYGHMPALRYTDDDAYRMYAFLKSPEGGALKDDQIRILIDEDATKANITKEMEAVFSQAGPNDLVMLYFSGHGLKGSFLPIDFDGFNNKLYHDEINAIFSNSPAKYKLCIADACHSGSLVAMKGATENALAKYYKTLAQAEPGTALIMSSKSEETSLESSGLRQGVFSHFLIRGLKGEADADANQVIGVQELFNFIDENVRSYTGLRQSPVIKGDYDPLMTVGVIR